jgi:twitching motility protein PilT
MINVGELLRIMVDKGASDLHLRVPSPPVLRIDGELIPQDDMPPGTAKDIELVLEHITSPQQRSVFLKEMDLDFAHSVTGLARFRVNAMRQRGTISLCFRMVPFEVPSIDQLGLPQVYKELVLKAKGLILVASPSGSGKSTTIAAMIDHLNESSKRNIIIIENPIEFLHKNKRCLIAQRDLGDDTKSLDTALTQSLHHDPDVIVISRLRDLPTVATAIRAAETGHLVLAAVQTADATQTVEHLIDVFPPPLQQQARLQLSQTILAISSQMLLPKAKGKGRVAAFEIMIANPEIRNLIREGKFSELNKVIQLNGGSGMQTMEQAMAALVNNGTVAREEVLVGSSHPERLKELLPPVTAKSKRSRRGGK